MTVKFWNMVWVDSTAVGRMVVSTPMAEMTGRATVMEHLPRQEMSWMVSMRFIGGKPPSFFADASIIDGSGLF